MNQTGNLEGVSCQGRAREMRANDVAAWSYPKPESFKSGQWIGSHLCGVIFIWRLDVTQKLFTLISETLL